MNTPGTCSAVTVRSGRPRPLHSAETRREPRRVARQLSVRSGTFVQSAGKTCSRSPDAMSTMYAISVPLAASGTTMLRLPLLGHPLFETLPLGSSAAAAGLCGLLRAAATAGPSSRGRCSGRGWLQWAAAVAGRRRERLAPLLLLRLGAGAGCGRGWAAAAALLLLGAGAAASAAAEAERATRCARWTG